MTILMSPHWVNPKYSHPYSNGRPTGPITLSKSVDHLLGMYVSSLSPKPSSKPCSKAVPCFWFDGWALTYTGIVSHRVLTLVMTLYLLRGCRDFRGFFICSVDVIPIIFSFQEVCNPKLPSMEVIFFQLLAHNLHVV